MVKNRCNGCETLNEEVEMMQKERGAEEETREWGSRQNKAKN